MVPPVESTQRLHTDNACPNSPYDVACLYNDGAHYICCDSKECGPIGPDGNTPICRGSGVTPSPNNYPSAGTPPSGPTPSSGDQGGKASGTNPFPRTTREFCCSVFSFTKVGTSESTLPKVRPIGIKWVAHGSLLFCMTQESQFRHTLIHQLGSAFNAFSGHDRFS
jgi:hypothetical protein